MRSLLVLIVVGLTHVVSRRYIPSKEKRLLSAKFHQCLGCLEGLRERQAKMDYLKCAEKRPSNYTEIMDKCKEKNNPGKNIWKEMCKDNEVAAKIYDCIISKEKEKYDEFSNDYKKKVIEFKECCDQVNAVYCTKIPPVKGITWQRQFQRKKERT